LAYAWLGIGGMVWEGGDGKGWLDMARLKKVGEAERCLERAIECKCCLACSGRLDMLRGDFAGHGLAYMELANEV
jgi:hypothetical protein